MSGDLDSGRHGLRPLAGLEGCLIPQHREENPSRLSRQRHRGLRCSGADDRKGPEERGGRGFTPCSTRAGPRRGRGRGRGSPTKCGGSSPRAPPASSTKTANARSSDASWFATLSLPGGQIRGCPSCGESRGSQLHRRRDKSQTPKASSPLSGPALQPHEGELLVPVPASTACSVPASVRLPASAPHPAIGRAMHPSEESQVPAVHASPASQLPHA